MTAADTRNLVEAALLGAGHPLSMTQLLALFDPLEEIGEGDVRQALGELERDYAGREIQLAEVAGGWRVQTGSAAAERLARLEKFRPPKFSRALLESLAAIAYRQPITRAEIEELRGVRLSGHIMRTLMERNWIEVVGHRETPGRPALYGTTRDFMDYFGLKRLDELPSSGEFGSAEDAPHAKPPGGAQGFPAGIAAEQGAGLFDETAESAGPNPARD
ncbi:MAG: SMC-Scp complex subunit ScpB [Gammaproteobacteria bacterium]|nr:SMC-Scp complex subunit ScpB [Gammaproteobacteria bacterium]MCY4164683.1 SMC-Scp complex subunit ScpB [Gammaproteobacteria bacterium]MCY4255429.1 SMC-Scp complex subunit ScpB [Gammaproteobacteria bacterium]MCY4340085.1 SMC-Scp complex subunit ScpB [Gammaproteobacteria bacterium]